MSALVLATVGIFAWAGYWQFGDNLYVNAGQRLASSAGLVSNLIAQTPPRWRTQLDEIATDPSVAIFLTTGEGEAAAVAALDRSNPARSRGRWRARLLDARGATVLDRAWQPARSWPAWADSVAASGSAIARELAVSPILAMDSIAVYELLLPVHEPKRSGGKPIGYVADTRALVESQSTIRGLVGDSVTMLLGQRNAGVWTDLERITPAPPRGRGDGRPTEFERSAYGPGVGAGKAIPGTPWEMWMQQPRHLVLAPVRDFVWRTVPIGALVAIIGALLVWIVSHRVTHRIVALTDQIETIVPEGTAGAKSVDDSRDELDRLGDAFDRMAVRVEEHQELEGKLRQAQKLEAVGRLAGGIAHDFNNILTVIRNYAEFVREELESDSPVTADVGEILAATDRASALTGQLLAFSRNHVVTQKILDLNEVIAGTESMLRRVVPSNIEVVTTLDEDLGLVCADRGQLEQVLLNLTINAADAMPDGGKLTIRTQRARLDETFSLKDTAVKPGRYASVIVTDTGAGMDRGTMVRIFDPFFTTKEVGKGTGLGLATVHGIVTQSGGYVRVYSEIGHGATFKIYLPEVAGEPSESYEISQPRDDAPVHETILLAEDDEQTREVTRRILAKRGYTVLEATDGEDALRLAERYPDVIEVVVSDMMMPGMRGGDLAGRLRKIRPNTAFLLMSGYSGLDMADRGHHEQGSLAFLEKPFTSESLLAAVRKVIEDADAVSNGD
jgi:signal transduction histidine kinase/ActR/RegA family two-component response regulator